MTVVSKVSRYPLVMYAINNAQAVAARRSRVWSGVDGGASAER
jgi:hypothetical protein